MCLFYKPIIAVDFDGVIRKESHASTVSDELMPDCKKYIKKLYDAGCELIVWTCRTMIDDKDLYHASVMYVFEFMHNHKLSDYFTWVNNNSNQLPWDTSNKIYADYYLDDLNLGGFPGWKKAYEIIMQDEYFKRGQNG